MTQKVPFIVIELGRRLIRSRSISTPPRSARARRWRRRRRGASGLAFARSAGATARPPKALTESLREVWRRSPGIPRAPSPRRSTSTASRPRAPVNGNRPGVMAASQSARPVIDGVSEIARVTTSPIDTRCPDLIGALSGIRDRTAIFLTKRLVCDKKSFPVHCPRNFVRLPV